MAGQDGHPCESSAAGQCHVHMHQLCNSLAGSDSCQCSHSYQVCTRMNQQEIDCCKELAWPIAATCDLTCDLRADIRTQIQLIWGPTRANTYDWLLASA